MVGIEADKLSSGALVQKYEAGINGFFKDDDAVLQFKKLNSVHEKLDFVWRSPSMQSYLKDCGEKDGGKSAGDTKRFREFGNNHFKAGRDGDAVRLFGEAARTAPVGEEGRGRELALALANRSAALLRLQQPGLALQDIELAVEAGYPAELHYKLEERRVRIAAQRRDRPGYHEALARLREALGEATGLEEGRRGELFKGAEELLASMDNDSTAEMNEEKSESKLLNVEIKDPCPFLPAMSNSIDIEWTEHRGRFAVANRAIEAGTLLVVEAAHAAVLHGDQDPGQRCDQCIAKIELVSVPCLGCSHAVYCGLACRQQAAGSHHQYECGASGLLKALTGSTATRDIGQLCYRALCARPAAWYGEQRQSLAERFPLFGDETWNDSEFPRTMQHALLSLDAHPASIEPGRLWSFLLCALCHVRALQLAGYFGPGRAGEKVPGRLDAGEVEVAGWAVRLLQLAMYNMQGITRGTELDSAIGHGLYPTAALINHGCDSNVTKFFDGSKLVVAASRDIREREEVADCYLPAAGQGLDRDQRRAWLHHYYRFLCECPVCVMEEKSVDGEDQTELEKQPEQAEGTGAGLGEAARAESMQAV